MDAKESAALDDKPSVSSSSASSSMMGIQKSSTSASPSMMGIQKSPCAGCKFLRRKCQLECVFAPYFPADQPDKFISVHRSFGASNVTKILNDLHPNDREFAVASLVYEANWRYLDPVNGCLNEIYTLQEKLKELRLRLSDSVVELHRYKTVLEALTNGNQVSQGFGVEQINVPLWHQHHLLQQQQQQQQHFFQQQHLLQQHQRMMITMGGHGAVAGEAAAGGGAYDQALVEVMDASPAARPLGPMTFGGQFAGFTNAREHGRFGHGHGYDDL